MDKVKEWYDSYNYKISQDINILEIGCKRDYLNKTVVDVSPKTIELARQTKFLVMDIAEGITFPKGCFDKVYAHGSLECIKNLENVFKNISAIMKKGAEFVFTIQRENWWIKLYRKWFRKPLEKDSYFTTKQYHLKEIKDMLNRWELKIVKVNYLYYGSIYLISARKENK